jgi:uncharacterized protein YdiU (UPF0061 family)
MNNEGLTEKQIYYKDKYLKYKLKYQELKQHGGKIRGEDSYLTMAKKSISSSLDNFSEIKDLNTDKLEMFFESKCKDDQFYKIIHDNEIIKKIIEKFNNVGYLNYLRDSSNRSINGVVDSILNDLDLTVKLTSTNIANTPFGWPITLHIDIDLDKEKLNKEKLKTYLLNLINKYDKEQKKIQAFNPEAIVRNLNAKVIIHDKFYNNIKTNNEMLEKIKDKFTEDISKKEYITVEDAIGLVVDKYDLYDFNEKEQLKVFLYSVIH